MPDKEPPFVPEIPQDAKTAGSHAAPIDLPNAVESSENIDAEAHRRDDTASNPQPKPQSKPAADSPKQEKGHPPTEAMFFQLREDQQRLQRMVMITLMALIVAGFIILWLSKPKALKFGKTKVSDV